MQERIMILGAGLFQLRAIQKAAALRYRVITVDYLPDNVGHNYSDQYIHCSTADADCVLKNAKDFHIDAICTFSSDVAVPSVGYVNDHLQLRGVSSRMASVMTSKPRFRKFQQEAGLAYPRYIHGREIDEVTDHVRRLKFPIVFKPADNSGSRGVSFLREPNVEAMSHLFEHAQSCSRSGVVCVEEFLEGVEVGGDALLVDGRFLFCSITQKHMRGVQVSGHRLPPDISERDQERVREELQRCCRALGYLDGPLNFDVMVSRGRITIIEISPRNGGNGISGVAARATGIDPEEMTLRWLLDRPLGLPHPPPSARGCGSYVFGAERSGVLRNVVSADALRADVPEVFGMHCLPPGTPVRSLHENGGMIGYALFECRDVLDYERLVGTIRRLLCVDIETGDTRTHG